MLYVARAFQAMFSCWFVTGGIKTAKYNIVITVTIDISGIHGEPFAFIKTFDGRWFELEGLGLFQINK